MYPAQAGSKRTVLTATMLTTDTQALVSDLSVFPPAPNLVTFQGDGNVWETCLYTSKSSETGDGYLTVSRSGDQHNSSSAGAALEWAAGANASRNPTGYDHDTVKANIEDHQDYLEALDGGLSTHLDDLNNPHKFPNPNLIINGGFTVNQRTYVSGTALAAGAFGHDRWKAGTGGATYSFTQLNAPTQITISAGSLIQVIENKNIAGGSYILSWEGTATARTGLNSATPSGSYVSSPITITGQTAGTVMSVEFSTGTLGKVKLESGSVVTHFVCLGYGAELERSQRYYQTGRFYAYGMYAQAANYSCGGTITFPVQMRATPTIILTQISGQTVNCANSSTVSWSDNSGYFAYRAAIGAGSVGFADIYTATSEI